MNRAFFSSFYAACGRTRRFGKSLLLNMLDSYYDINNAERFEQLFGMRWIYQNETDLRARFLVMRFNFSMVDSRPENLQSSFEDHCKMRLLEFILRYKRFFPEDFEKEVMAQSTAASRLQYIDRIASDLGLRIYLFIDEYDNFTNSILATMGREAYRDATHGEGFFRYFFNVLKGLTTSSGAALERMFITGVSPLA